jgi:probable F420-dependent oxidoreductase
MVEDRGFESFWVPEHSHIPASRESPYPFASELPQEYAETWDPFVALALAASATTTLRIGTAITLVIERDPIHLAKSIATLDRASNGRLLVGVGAGWNLEEMSNHGTDPSRRFGILRERIEAMRAIWTQDEASYHGEHVDFDRIWCRPKPVQQPGPPILLGGGGPRVLDRVLRYADGWFPIVMGLPVLLARVEELRARAADAGRDIPVTFNALRPDPAKLAICIDAGIERGVFWLPQGDAGAIEAALDRIAAAVASARGD